MLFKPSVKPFAVKASSFLDLIVVAIAALNVLNARYNQITAKHVQSGIFWISKILFVLVPVLTGFMVTRQLLMILFVLCV